MKIDEIEELCKYISPGEWSAETCFDYWPNGDTKDAYIKVAPESGSIVYLSSDEEFIVASRELVPKLLKVAKAAKHLAAHTDECGDSLFEDRNAMYLALAELEKE